MDEILDGAEIAAAVRTARELFDREVHLLAGLGAHLLEVHRTVVDRFDDRGFEATEGAGGVDDEADDHGGRGLEQGHLGADRGRNGVGVEIGKQSGAGDLGDMACGSSLGNGLRNV